MERVVDPRSLFFEVLHQMHNHNVEIPSYHTLAELISNHYITHEKKLLKIIETCLNDTQKNILQSLLLNSEMKYESKLTRYKTINQSLQPKAIQASIKTFEQISDLIIPLMPLIKPLSLTQQSCEYYATWVKKAKLSQLKQFADVRKLYLHLIAFLQHQYYSRQDIFVDVFLRSVRSAKNSALHQIKNVEQITRGDRRSAVRHLAKSRHGYKVLIDEITEITRSTIHTDTGKVQRIAELLAIHEKKQDEKEQKKLELFEKSLDDMVKDKNYFDILENLSRKLKNRVSDILKILSFNPDNSDKTLLNAINYFNQMDGKIDSNAPQDLFNLDEKSALTNENGIFRTSLYKILLFIHVADGIKSGRLNLKHSYRYLAIQDYLVNKAAWKLNRNELLKLARLDAFSDYNAVITNLKKLLDEKYHVVNKRISKNLNPCISFNDSKENAIQITTPALEEKETKHISAFLNQIGLVPILQVLSDVDHVTRFTKTFSHHSVKNSKLKPQTGIFYAEIIGLGCNIGISKLVQISIGINQNTMINAVNWFFSIKHLLPQMNVFANSLIVWHCLIFFPVSKINVMDQVMVEK